MLDREDRQMKIENAEEMGGWRSDEMGGWRLDNCHWMPDTKQPAS